MKIRGQHIVALIFLAGTLMGGYAWWHTYERGRRSLAVWGSQAALRIRYERHAPRVELWRLTKGAVGGNPSTLMIEGDVHTVEEKTDISKVRGLVHARHALVEDASFVWDEQPDGGAAEWEFALHFAGPKGHSTVVFDVRRGRVALLEPARTAILRPPLRATFSEKSVQWARAAARSTPTQGL